MADRNPTKGRITGIVGEITKAERAADRVANAEQDTRPLPTLEIAREALRRTDSGT